MKIQYLNGGLDTDQHLLSLINKSTADEHVSRDAYV